MFVSTQLRRLAARFLAIGGVVVLLVGAAAASSLAASLKVTVPSKIHKGSHFSIRIHGTFSSGQVSGRAYLISIIQYSRLPCEASAQAENNDRGNSIDFYFAPANKPENVGVYESHSPFNRTDRFTAGAPGVRRVCAYLYPTFIGATSPTMPIARAGHLYKVVK